MIFLSTVWKYCFFFFQYSLGKISGFVIVNEAHVSNKGSNFDWQWILGGDDLYLDYWNRLNSVDGSHLVEAFLIVWVWTIRIWLKCTKCICSDFFIYRKDRFDIIIRQVDSCGLLDVWDYLGCLSLRTLFSIMAFHAAQVAFVGGLPKIFLFV